MFALLKRTRNLSHLLLNPSLCPPSWVSDIWANINGACNVSHLAFEKWVLEYISEGLSSEISIVCTSHLNNSDSADLPRLQDHFILRQGKFLY